MNDNDVSVPYELGRSLLGRNVQYSCPLCGTSLINPLTDAGAHDQCPKCDGLFIVPGASAKKARVDSEKDKVEFKQVQAKDLRSLEKHRREENKKRTLQKAAAAAYAGKHIQLDRNPLREWYVYVGVMFFLLYFAAGDSIYKAIVTDETHLCLVIFFLFGVGLVLNYLGVYQLKVEYVCAADCMQKLKGKGGFQKAMSELPAGIFHKHIQDLSKISKYDSNFTQDSLITFLYRRLMAKAKIVQILSSVLVSLGLIGTVLGLIQMTQGLSRTMDSMGGGDNSSLLSGMRETMSGLGTAFYTTLIGAIFGSVVLRILNNAYTSNVDHLVTYVASTAEVQIIPSLKKNAKMEKGE